MKARYRKQRVVLRDRARKERWKWWTHNFFKWGLRSLFIGAGLALLLRLHSFLFHSNFFMVKSVSVTAGENLKISSRIQKQLESLKGKSIFSFSTGEIESDMKDQFSGIDSVNIIRSFPDHLEARYELRKPLAILKVGLDDADLGPHKVKLIDGSGTVYTEEVLKESIKQLPEVVSVSTGSLAVAMRFLKSWSEKRMESHLDLATGCLRELEVNPWGEVSLILREEGDAGLHTQLFWGGYDAQVFSEKFDRLRAVWADLKQKNISAEYINIRHVPEETILALGNKKIIGRVIVRPIAKKDSEKAG